MMVILILIFIILLTVLISNNLKFLLISKSIQVKKNTDLNKLRKRIDFSNPDFVLVSNN